MVRDFVTIGHSNRPADMVIEMLRAANVGLVADVRNFPRSRTNPVFNIDDFPSALEQVQIGYCHFKDLGGRRPKQPDIDPAINAMWRVQSFHNYADYALGPVYETAFHELLALGETRRVALMCSEAVWWRCHRRIISDYLLAGGDQVTHLMAPGRSDPAHLTEWAKPQPNGTVIYPSD